MSGLIADEAIRTVRERASLSEFVAEVVSLKRRGASGLGLCPFHSEKTPSFNVNEERGFFHCFGCGEHGDVFTFLMKTQALSFPEAVQQVADRVGVELPRELGGGARPPTAGLVEAHVLAADFYRAALRGPAGTGARAYLAERGVTDASVERFGLGYAPAAGDVLARHLRARGIGREVALETGLVLPRDRGGEFDRFRDRIMFPIADGSGRVCAFGGRILPGATRPGDPPPKYLNSPESPIFRKGRVVYGLPLAREAIRRRERVVVVEGYLDVIALAQAGVEEVVAPLGTALTIDQLRVLRRFSDRVIACFDGDDAGRRAAARAFPIFVDAGLWGYGVFLPAGDDPDTFVRTHGPAAAERALGAAVPLVDAFVRDLAGPRADAVGRHADAARDVLRVLKRLDDPLEREPLIRLAAHHLGVREETLMSAGAPTTSEPVRSASTTRHAAGAEALLIELMAMDRSLTGLLAGGDLLADFEEPAWRQAAERLLEARDDEAHRAAVETLPPDLRDRVARRLVGEADDSTQREHMFADCMARIASRGRFRRLRELTLALQDAEGRGDVASATETKRQIRQLNDLLSEQARR
jgi:DNA primase